MYVKKNVKNVLWRGGGSADRYLRQGSAYCTSSIKMGSQLKGGVCISLVGKNPHGDMKT